MIQDVLTRKVIYDHEELLMRIAKQGKSRTEVLFGWRKALTKTLEDRRKLTDGTPICPVCAILVKSYNVELHKYLRREVQPIFAPSDNALHL